jgi:hypothetical protein
LSDYTVSVQNLKARTSQEDIQLIGSGLPEIFYLPAITKTKEELIVISPGLGTRQLHLIEPFIGFQLNQLGYSVAVINTLDLQLYNLETGNPFERVKLTQAAYKELAKIFPETPLIALGHSLGCIDLLRAQPTNIQAAIFTSPGFRGDKKKIKWKSFLDFVVSFSQNNSLKLNPHGLTPRPELNDYKSDWIDAHFLWNLQKYAHDLEKTHHWPLDKPSFLWLGSDDDTDGVVRMEHASYWADKMTSLNPDIKVSIQANAGHEPGWRNPIDAINLAKELDLWIELSVRKLALV